MDGSDMDALKDVCHRSHVGDDDTVAILAQGTSWAVAVTQAFLFLRMLTCGVVNGMNNNNAPPHLLFDVSPTKHNPRQCNNQGVSHPEQPRRKPEAPTTKA